MRYKLFRGALVVFALVACAGRSIAGAPPNLKVALQNKKDADQALRDASTVFELAYAERLRWGEDLQKKGIEQLNSAQIKERDRLMKNQEESEKMLDHKRHLLMLRNVELANIAAELAEKSGGLLPANQCTSEKTEEQVLSNSAK